MPFSRPRKISRKEPNKFSKSSSNYPSLVTPFGIQSNVVIPPGGGVIGSSFAGHVPMASQNPHPIIVYSVANYIDPILATFGQMS